MTKRLSKRGEEHTKRFETLRLKAYRDQAGIWTNGWGHTGADVHPDQVVTVEQAQAWFDRDTDEAEAVVNALDAKRALKLTQGQFDALVGFEFNTGALSNPRNQITKLVVACRDDLVDDEMLRWCHVTDPATGKKVVSRGLKRRRLAEAEMFASAATTQGVVDLPAVESHMDATSVPVAPPTPAQSAAKSPAVQGGTLASVSAVMVTATEQIKPLAEHSDTLRLVFVVLALAGVALAIYGAVRSHRTGVAA